MSIDYLRYCSLIVGNQQGQGIDLSALRINFSVHDRTLQSRRGLVARVYNLSYSTINSILSQATSPGGAQTTIESVAFASGLTVTLIAGYQDHYGIIFYGQIYQLRTGKQTNVDSYLDIFAADADLTYNYSTIARTLAKGHSQLDVWNACAQASGTVASSPTPTMQPGTATRAKTCFGLVRETLRDHAVTNQINWQFRDNALQGLTIDGIPPGQAVELNSLTGLIGVPEQTNNGIMVTSLLNSQYKCQGLIKLNESDIARSAFNLNGQPGQYGVDTNAGTSFGGTPGYVAPVGSDGFYKIIMVSHAGDTRGNAWYSYLTCVSADPTTTPFLVPNAGAGAQPASS